MSFDRIVFHTLKKRYNSCGKTSTVGRDETENRCNPAVDEGGIREFGEILTRCSVWDVHLPGKIAAGY